MRAVAFSILPPAPEVRLPITPSKPDPGDCLAKDLHKANPPLISLSEVNACSLLLGWFGTFGGNYCVIVNAERPIDYRRQAAIITEKSSGSMGIYPGASR